MRAILQRVSQAQVNIAGQIVGSIERGWLILLGISADDGTKPDLQVRKLVEKIVHLRAFADDQGKMNRSVLDINGGLLVVSNFTLYADCRSGRRPSFTNAASPKLAEPLYERFVQLCLQQGIPTATGRFGADMQVELINDGPVTFLLDTEDF